MYKRVLCTHCLCFIPNSCIRGKLITFFFRKWLRSWVYRNNTIPANITPSTYDGKYLPRTCYSGVTYRSARLRRFYDFKCREDNIFSGTMPKPSAKINKFRYPDIEPIQFLVRCPLKHLTISANMNYFSISIFRKTVVSAGKNKIKIGHRYLQWKKKNIYTFSFPHNILI